MSSPGSLNPASHSRISGVRITVIVAVMTMLLLGGVALVQFMPRGAARRPNLVLIVLDTVRFDRTSLAGRNTTPFLASLASRGVSFTRARSPAEWTLPAHASIFTGRLPSEHGCHFEHRYLNPEVVTIAEALRRAEFDYQTAGFSSNVNIGRAFNFDQGFDHFFEAFAPAAVKSHGTRSAAILADLDAWLHDHKREPLFLFINLMEAHLPYEVAPEHAAKLSAAARALDLSELGSGDFLDRVLAGERELEPGFTAALAERYDAALATVDDRLRDVVLLLERHGVLGDEGILIVTSDHGEHLGESGLVDHHGALSEALLRVPVVIVGAEIPGDGKGDAGSESGASKTISDPVGTHDIARWLDGFAIPERAFDPSRFHPPDFVVSERYPAVEIVERLARARPGVDRSFLDVAESAIVANDGRFKLTRSGTKSSGDDTPDGKGAVRRLWRLDPGGGAGETEVALDSEPDVVASLELGLEFSMSKRRIVVERFVPEPPAALSGGESAEAEALLAQTGYGSPAPRNADSVHAQIHLERGNRLLGRGERAAARAEYEGAVRLDADFAAAWFNLATIAEQSGATSDEQKRAWEKYVDVALRATPEDHASIQLAYSKIAALGG